MSHKSFEVTNKRSIIYTSKTCYKFSCSSFWVGLSDVTIFGIISKVEENQWVHLALNYKGTNKEIEVIRDGALVPGQSFTSSYNRPPGDDRLVLGKRETQEDGYYSSVDLDELVFFNRKLTAPELETIYDKDI